MKALTLLITLSLLSGGCKVIDGLLPDGNNTGSSDTGTYYEDYADMGPPEVEWVAPQSGDHLGDEEEVLLDVTVSPETESVEYRICRLDADCSQGSGEDTYYGGVDTMYPPDVDMYLNEYYFAPSGTCIIIQAHARNPVDYTDVNIEVCF